MTAALEGGEWSATRPGRTLPPWRRPGTHFKGGWVGPRAGLDDGYEVARTKQILILTRIWCSKICNQQIVLRARLMHGSSGIPTFIEPEIPLLTYLLTYLHTPWCRVLLQQLTGLQLVKKFPAFHGTRRFITALTSVRHLSLSWACPVQSIYPHPTSWRFILILSTHLRLGLPSGLFPSGFPTKTHYHIKKVTLVSLPVNRFNPKRIFVYYYCRVHLKIIFPFYYYISHIIACLYALQQPPSA